MKTRILIVEDEGLIALDLKRKLEQVGYTVPAIHNNASDAIQSVERIRPDLVLMDIRLRGPVDGIQAAAIIRERFRLPVMFVSAHSDRATLERARVAEPFGYIVKPFHGVDFQAPIEMALWRHKMEQKLRVSESWLAATFENVADAFIATDSEGKIAFMNKRAAALTGWEVEDCKGRPLLEVFQVFDEMTNVPIAHPLEGVLDAIYQGWELASESRTFRLRRRGGSEPVLVEAELSSNRDEGSLLGMIVVFRDITERHRSDREMAASPDTLARMVTDLERELAESLRQMEASLPEPAEESEEHTLQLLGQVRERCAYQQMLVQQLLNLEKTQVRGANEAAAPQSESEELLCRTAGGN